MGNWVKGKDSFKANPPNAVIVDAALKTNENGIAQVISVELINPEFTANGWRFGLKDFQGKEIPVGSYNRISVFVDDSDDVNGDFQAEENDAPQAKWAPIVDISLGVNRWRNGGGKLESGGYIG
ncbi:MAG: hypothetical protein NTY13_01650 [Chlamydiae bacterium]|nr:hypothetical protein [Chlamydiota bacterium]